MAQETAQYQKRVIEEKNKNRHPLKEEDVREFNELDEDGQVEQQNSEVELKDFELKLVLGVGSYGKVVLTEFEGK